ncbi:MAG: cyclase family protein [Flavobacteriia bacterium]|nr:cyclase family protein [Flavobacteriia bacterium]
MKLFLDTENFIDTNQPLDISIPLSNTSNNLKAWYVDTPMIEPVRIEGFIGLVAEGGSVNFRNIFFNPHGHGTHTECLGHITPEIYSVNTSLKTYFFNAYVLTIIPEIKVTDCGIDLVITKAQLEEKLKGLETEALIIRTLPNDENKQHQNYSDTNPAYLDCDCISIIDAIGVKHLLVDLPSVDKESDGGILAFHHAFWKVPENPQFDKTITEFVFVKDSISDGHYILNLQTAPFENDASPSRPVLYKIIKG